MFRMTANQIPFINRNKRSVASKACRIFIFLLHLRIFLHGVNLTHVNQCMWVSMLLVDLKWTWNNNTGHCCPPLSIFCCCLKSHLFSLSYPTFWPFSHLYSACAVTHHFGHFNCFSARQHICDSALYTIAHPSVCPPVTRVDQSKMAAVRIMQPSPQSSPWL